MNEFTKGLSKVDEAMAIRITELVAKGDLEGLEKLKNELENDNGTK